MKFWLLKDDRADWDEYEGFVIVAETAAQARKIASEHDGEAKRNSLASPGEPKWIDASRTSCVSITVTRDTGIVLAAFNAG